MRTSIALIMVAATAAVGCGDHVSPRPFGTLSGTVTDSTGSPISGASINIGYLVWIDADTLDVPPLFSDWDVQDPVHADSLAPPDSFLVEIYDHLDRLVWSGQELIWNGRDLAGDRIPDGPYRSSFTTWNDGNEQTTNHDSWIILTWQNLNERAEVSLAQTNGNGQFEVSFPEIPVWESYPVRIATDPEDPDPFQTRWVTFDEQFVVYAFRGDGTTTYARETVRVEDRHTSVGDIDLVIP